MLCFFCYFYIFFFFFCFRLLLFFFFFFFQAEDGIRDKLVTGVQTCALPISSSRPCGAAATYCASRMRPTNAFPPDAFYSKPPQPRRKWRGFCFWDATPPRSEERRVGKECRSRWSAYH